MAKAKITVNNVPMVELVAAGLTAWKQNGETIYRTTLDGQTANKSIALDILENNKPISEEILTEAKEMIDYVNSVLMMKTLAGKMVNDLHKSIYTASQNEEGPMFSIGLLLYLPSVYKMLKDQAVIDEQTTELKYESKSLGLPGSKVELDFTPIRVRSLSEYNAYSVYGKDGNGNLISFMTASKKLCKGGKIKGKVKSSGLDKYNLNAMVTRLNYVKAVV